jgi:cytochrome c-type biogenesis protein CcmH/NrfG
VPPFDRERALKSAEPALRQGRIDVAIGEYQEVVEIHPRDWNAANALGDLHVRATDSQESAPAPRSLDQVFQGIRDEVSRRSEEEEADEQYVLAQTYREMGMIEDAVRSLEHASRSPRHRCDAAAMLGRIYFEQRDFI